MDGAGPTVFERIEHRLSALGAHVDNSDIAAALKQVDENLTANPADMESKLARLELKVVELARMLDAALSAIEGGNGAAVPAAVPSAASFETQQAPQAAPRQVTKKIKKLQQNPATGVIEEVEVDDQPSEHFIVADGRARFTATPGEQQRDNKKKSVFIAAADDEPVRPVKK